jgi:prepilin-type N-terminal cleavage/methylation domain-containing protein
VRDRARRGNTLIELMVAVVVVGVLSTLGIPRFSRSLEQSRADVAAANLRAIWTAQRMYWLNDPNRQYATTLQALYDQNLLDRSLTSSNANYSYKDPEPDPDDSSGFVIKAERAAGSSWSGFLQINTKGEISSTLTGQGGPIIPAVQ